MRKGSLISSAYCCALRPSRSRFEVRSSGVHCRIPTKGVRLPYVIAAQQPIVIRLERKEDAKFAASSSSPALTPPSVLVEP